MLAKNLPQSGARNYIAGTITSALNTTCATIAAPMWPVSIEADAAASPRSRVPPRRPRRPTTNRATRRAAARSSDRSIQSEGKSTTGANLAIALADAGARVLLVDVDLRRPKVADYVGIEGAVGLTDALIGRAEFDDVIQPWGRAALLVLPAGQVPPNPSELLGSTRLPAARTDAAPGPRAHRPTAPILLE